MVNMARMMPTIRLAVKAMLTQMMIVTDFRMLARRRRKTRTEILTRDRIGL